MSFIEISDIELLLKPFFTSYERPAISRAWPRWVYDQGTHLVSLLEQASSPSTVQYPVGARQIFSLHLLDDNNRERTGQTVNLADLDGGRQLTRVSRPPERRDLGAEDQPKPCKATGHRRATNIGGAAPTWRDGHLSHAVQLYIARMTPEEQWPATVGTNKFSASRLRGMRKLIVDHPEWAGHLDALVGGGGAIEPLPARRRLADVRQGNSADADSDAGPGLALARLAPRVRVPVAMTLPGVTWGSFAWQVVGLVVQRSVVRYCDDADAVQCVLRDVNQATAVLAAAATQYLAACGPGERRVTNFIAFCQANALPRLQQLRLWQADLFTGYEGVLCDDRRVELVLEVPTPSWRNNVLQMRDGMYGAGMGVDVGPPDSLASSWALWLRSGDMNCLSIPPPQDYPLAHHANGLCGYVPCPLCTAPTERALLHLLVRVPAGGGQDHLVFVHKANPAPLLFAQALPPYPLEFPAQADSHTVCPSRLLVWDSLGTVTSSSLDVMEMSLVYAADPGTMRRAYLVYPPGSRDDSAFVPVITLAFFFDMDDEDGQAVRVKHEIYACNCQGTQASLVTYLRDATAGTEPGDDPLCTYIATLLSRYRHCVHTLFVQARVISLDPRHKIPLAKLRCLARRSACCGDADRHRDHGSLVFPPLQPAGDEREYNGEEFTLFTASVENRLKALVVIANDSAAMLERVAPAPLKARCCNMGECGDGSECEHSAAFTRHAVIGGFSFDKFRELSGASRFAAPVAVGAAPGAVPGAASADTEQAQSITSIPPKLPDDITTIMASINVGFGHWVLGLGLANGPGFAFTDEGVKVWDLCCPEPGCSCDLNRNDDDSWPSVLHSKCVIYLFCFPVVSLTKILTNSADVAPFGRGIIRVLVRSMGCAALTVYVVVS
jgi:hypothetical protein